MEVSKVEGKKKRPAKKIKKKGIKRSKGHTASNPLEDE
jgi:hypothetical protein